MREYKRADKPYRFLEIPPLNDKRDRRNPHGHD
ncbi:MAG: hypothetical protein QG641_2130, partial [Candidatus Poribacteria bacterium]|nr:hypothetical protein [Candidatus Poribacteria bacterium]